VKLLTGVALVGLAVLLSGCAVQQQSQTPSLDDLFSSDEDRASEASCLRDRGWDVTEKDGAIVIEIPESQKDAYQRDSQECQEATGFDADKELTDSNYDDIYEWYSSIGECLDGAGFDVPTRPSREVFQETYNTEPWIPWDGVSLGEMDRAKELCPEMDPKNL